jgi:hypothetical protein
MAALYLHELEEGHLTSNQEGATLCCSMEACRPANTHVQVPALLKQTKHVRCVYGLSCAVGNYQWRSALQMTLHVMCDAISE